MLQIALTLYLWIAAFTALSFIGEWKFTGSAKDYDNLHDHMASIELECSGSGRWLWFFVWLLATGLWPVVYYYRLRDLSRGGEW